MRHDEGWPAGDHAPVDFGLSERPSASGDHVCALCFGPRERNVVLATYLHAGLAAGGKCLCIVETSDQPVLIAGMADSIEIEACIASGQLELLGAAQSYLRGGSFSADDMSEFWEERVERVLAQGRFELARIGVVMTGMVQAADDLSDVALYESELNRLATRYRLRILCVYDIELVGGGIVAALVRTHPTLVVGGLGIENPHSLGPDEYLTTWLERRHGWTALSDSERRLAELLAQGLTASEAGQRLSLDRPTLDRHLHRLFRKLQVTSREDLVRVVRERRGRQ
jgi:DNA-binding CsgD family transcriptional regulator